MKRVWVGIAVLACVGIWVHADPQREKVLVTFGHEVWQALSENATKQTGTKQQSTSAGHHTTQGGNHTETPKASGSRTGAASANASKPESSSGGGLIIKYLPPPKAPDGASCVIVDPSNHIEHVSAAEWNRFVTAHLDDYVTGTTKINGQLTFVAEAFSLVEPKTPVYYIDDKQHVKNGGFAPVSAAEYQAKRAQLLAEGYKEYQEGTIHDLIAPHTVVQDLLNKTIYNP